MSNSQQNSQNRESSIPNDHSHRSVEQIIHELRISPVERFLLWLAKTDYYVLYISTFKSRSNLAGLGAMVVFTAMLAFVSSFYTLSSTLIGEDVPARYFFCFLIASIYTYGIALIDREIVGATSTRFLSTIARVLFAVVIATAVSYPAKLKFFDGRIDLQLNEDIKTSFAQDINELESLKQSALINREAELQGNQALIAQKQETRASSQAEFERELADRGGIGPKSLQLKEFVDQMDAEIRELSRQYSEMVRSPRFPAPLQARIDNLDQEIKAQRKETFDLLSKFQALKKIEAEDPSVATLSWFILLFFMLLELVPLALKWSLGSTEYHLYIEARNVLNKQKIASITNHFVGRMQENIENVFDTPREVTDLIAYVLEDEAKNVQQTRSFNETINNSYRSSNNRFSSNDSVNNARTNDSSAPNIQGHEQPRSGRPPDETM